MKVSVLIPYHNEGKYIKDCLASLEEQTSKDFDVYVICDHCTVESMQQLREIEVSFSLTVLEMRDETGVAAARNIGIKNSDQEYVLFLDADDYLENYAIEELLAKAEGKDVVFAEHAQTWYGRKVYYDNGKQLDAQNSGREFKEEDDNLEVEEQNNSDLSEYPLFGRMAHNCFYYDRFSVLGMLIRREYLMDLDLLFDEEYQYFTDLAFVTRLLCNTNRIEDVAKTLYIKRKHNDPINLPSLMQISDDKTKVLEGIRSYQTMKAELKDRGNAANLLLDRKFIRYYVTKVAPFYITGAKKDSKEVYQAVADCLPQISEEAKKQSKRFSKNLINFSLKNDYSKIAKKVSRHSSLQTLSRVMKSRAALKKYLYRKVFSKMKMMNDTVIFESFFGRNYSDSPKYIFEYLNQTYPGKYKYIWILQKKEKLPYPAKCIKRFSFQYYFYMARVKYIVFNGRQPQYFIKRKGNVFLETWHGTPLKKLVFDMDEVTTASPLYKKQFYMQTRSWDYLVAPNQFSEDVFRHAFMYDGKMLETGYPRNDILHLEDKSVLTDEVKRELGIPREKKVILYAPTWRDDEFYGSGQYKFTMKLDLAKMKAALGDEYVILLRTHYFVVDFLDLSEFEGFAYNVSRYDDIARLYLISDLLITDYSSVFFDYANLKRPMLFFTYDLEKYRSVLRGFYIDVEEELPGPMLFTTEEVLHAIQNLPQVENLPQIGTDYQAKYEKFYNKYCGWENGTATKQVVDTVFGK